MAFCTMPCSVCLSLDESRRVHKHNLGIGDLDPDNRVPGRLGFGVVIASFFQVAFNKVDFPALGASTRVA